MAVYTNGEGVIDNSAGYRESGEVAQRLVYLSNSHDTSKTAMAITDAQGQACVSAACWNFAEVNCARLSRVVATRRHCVVEASREIGHEKTGEFRGRYHVLSAP